MKKIISLVLALAMITLALASCGGGGSSSKVEINYTVSIIANGERILDKQEHTIKVNPDDVPTVLVAVIDALSDNPNVTVDADENMFTSVTINGTKYSMGKDDANIYAWIYMVDGVEPKEGKMNTNLIADGQNIELELISEAINTNTNTDVE